MAIVVCGLSHKTVPLQVLEQVAFTPDALSKSLARLLDHDPIHEGAILSTCNRTEVYASVHRFHPAIEAIRHFLSAESGIAQDQIANGLYTYYDAEATRHLFNVASGTDSMVVGESQILGQVREAFRAATEEGTVRRMLHQLFQRALFVGKRARSETAISRHVTSIPQAGARVATELAGGLASKRVVVVGAGRMGELAARALVDNGATDVVIANRTPRRAEALARDVGARAVSLDDLSHELSDADVFVSTTSSAGHIVERRDLARRVRPLVIVDLAVPRDVDPDARALDGIILKDIEDLRPVVEKGAELRRAELPKVEAIVSEAVNDFHSWERSLALAPAIESLQQWAERIRAAEVAKIGRQGDVDAEELERTTKALVNKLLHNPMVRMRELVRGKDGQIYLEAFQEIFDLDVE
jgi:glutamyl-tRNA reductase